MKYSSYVSFVIRVKHLKYKTMSNLPNISEMSVVEYVDYLQSLSLHLGISPFELNMEYHLEIGVVNMEKYERAKAELLVRSYCAALEREWPERG